MTPISLLRQVFDLNTRLFLNCLKGVTDEMAGRRLTETTNNLAFLGCHLIEARCFVGSLLGQSIPNPCSALEGARSIDDVGELPSMAEIRDAWNDVASRLERAFEGASEEQLRQRSPQRFPLRDESVLGGVAFLAQHESYHVGQMALLRKAVGLGAMEYGTEE